jgi:hypothetical protein
MWNLWQSPPAFERNAPSPLQLASSGIARDLNRDTILGIIRASQLIARADISRRSGLQPSAVSQIVEQLLAKKWILEGVTEDRPRGRKPTPLMLNGNLLIFAN